MLQDMTGGWHEEEAWRGDKNSKRSPFCQGLFSVKRWHISWCMPLLPCSFFLVVWKVSSMGLNVPNAEVYFDFSCTCTHFVVLSLPLRWQLNNNSCLTGLWSATQSHPHILPRLCVSATAFKTLIHLALMESSSRLSSALTIFGGVLSCKLPRSHLYCPASRLPLRSVYLSRWSLSVGRCPYISIQSFPLSVYHDC